MASDWGTEKLQYKLQRLASCRKMASGNVATKFKRNSPGKWSKVGN